MSKFKVGDRVVVDVSMFVDPTGYPKQGHCGTVTALDAKRAFVDFGVGGFIKTSARPPGWQFNPRCLSRAPEAAGGPEDADLVTWVLEGGTVATSLGERAHRSVWDAYVAAEFEEGK